jgi:ABC-2 type transport system permease protein
VFGRAVAAGLGPAGAMSYVDYLAPGILVMTVAAGALPSAVSVATDMSEGIIDRFRTMPIARSAVLTGHVVGGLLRTLLTAVLLTGIALLAGFRPRAGVAGWLGVAGLVAAFAFAMTWLAVALGLAAKTPAGANISAQLISSVLPFLSSAFVPTGLISPGLRWFAEYQPFTPMVNSVRDLLLGLPGGRTAVLALAWCAIIGIVGFAWATMTYRGKTA